MDLIKSSCVRKFYDYYVNCQEDERVQIDEIKNEYKSGMMDPCREAAMFEKSTAIKKPVIKSKMKTSK